MSAWPTDPPVLLVGYEHLRAGARQLDADALRFLFSVELAHIRCGHPILSLDDGLVGTSRSMYATLGRVAGPAENLVDLMMLIPGIDQVQKIQRLVRVSRKIFRARTALDKATELATPVLSWLSPEREEQVGLTRAGLSGSAMQIRMHADRVALWTTGDVRAALRGMLAASNSSGEHMALFESMGLAKMLREPPSWLASDEAIRMSAMLSFAAEYGPFHQDGSEGDLDANEDA